MKPATASATPSTHSVKFKVGGIEEINKGEFVLNLEKVLNINNTIFVLSIDNAFPENVPLIQSTVELKSSCDWNELIKSV